jgi:shikimate kinase
METHVSRAREAISARKLTLEKKNSEVFVTLHSARNKTHEEIEARIQEFEKEQEQLTANLQHKYKIAFNDWMNFRK